MAHPRAHHQIITYIKITSRSVTKFTNIGHNSKPVMAKNVSIQIFALGIQIVFTLIQNYTMNEFL